VIGQRSSKLIMVKYIVCSFASFQLVVNNKEETKILGVDRRNIKKVYERCLLLDTLGSTFWTNYKKVMCTNSLSKHFWHLVIDSLQGILSIHTHAFMTSVQINHFCDFRYDYLLWHLVKMISSHINDYKVVCNCICNLHL
jgi:hypothetical protein